MQQITVVKRGRFHQITFADKSKVVAHLTGCVVRKAFTSSDGKKYVKLDMTGAIGDKQLLLAVEERIKEVANPKFSPLRFAWEDVTAKLFGTKWELDGQPAAEWELREGDVVDMSLSPGAFGPFGWCLLVARINRKFP